MKTEFLEFLKEHHGCTASQSTLNRFLNKEAEYRIKRLYFIPQARNAPSKVRERQQWCEQHMIGTDLSNAIFIDGKQTITFGQAWAIVDFGDTGLAPALLQANSRCASVGDDVATNGLLRVGVEHGARATIDLSYNLVGNNDSNTEFVSQSLQVAHKLGEMCLSRGQLASA